MTATMRIWSALAPALLICAWVLTGFIAFCVRSLLWGVPKDPETSKRGGSLLAGEFLRHYFFWMLRPVWALVTWSGVPPMAITTLSLLMGIASGFAAAAGRFALAGWLFIFSGILDTFDGRLARQSKQVTTWGAAVDSTLDRLSDMAVLMGLAWYYRTSWVLLMCLLSMTGATLVPYIRARGEALGVTIKDGLAQRVERVLYLGGGVALSPILEAIFNPGDPRPPHRLAVVALVALAVTTNYTATKRLLTLVKALKTKSGLITRRAPPRRVGITFALTTLLSTVADFSLMYILVSRFNLSGTTATAFGCLLGAGIHLNLIWLAAAPSPDWRYTRRYMFTTFTGLLLNVGGVAMLGTLPFSFLVAWLVTRAAVFALWDIPLLSSFPPPGERARIPPTH